MTQAISGGLRVANDVLADIAGYAALGCYGVVGMASPRSVGDIAKLLPQSRFRRGVCVESTDKGIHIDLYVIMEYGTNIKAISKNLVDQVQFALTEYTQVPLDGVDVHVRGIKVRH